MILFLEKIIIKEVLWIYLKIEIIFLVHRAPMIFGLENKINRGSPNKKIIKCLILNAKQIQNVTMLYFKR